MLLENEAVLKKKGDHSEVARGRGGQEEACPASELIISISLLFSSSCKHEAPAVRHRRVQRSSAGRLLSMFVCVCLCVCCICLKQYTVCTHQF